MKETLLGAVEAGGTKFICAIGTPSGAIIDEIRIQTRTPLETMSEVISFFRRANDIRAFGIGSFGPIDLRTASPTYGYITSTPKLAWRFFDIVGTLQREFGKPVGFDTDVNAAALAEARWGSARGLQTIVYITVGTGIGGGAITEGSLLHGLVHPEMGHIRVPHNWDRDPFPGVCPYHGDCLEGLASGAAIEARWGVSPPTLDFEHEAFRLEAEYLALGCVNWICTISPQRLILGGGVMQPHMFPLIRGHIAAMLNGYVDSPELNREIDTYVAPPILGQRTGVLGALALAARAATFA